MMRLETKNWPRPIVNMRINCNRFEQTPELAREDIMMLLVGTLKPAMRSIFCSLILVGGFGTHALAELQPTEIAIVAARGNRESEGLAAYYARARGVPSENICLVKVPSGEVCPRETWRSAIRPEINKWLVEKDPQQKIRCLVTMFGVPLKIGPTSADAQLVRYQQFLAAERSHRLQLFTEVLDGFDNLASNETSAKATEAVSKAKGTTANTAEKPAGTIAKAPNLAATNSGQPSTGPTDQPAAEISRFQVRLETALQAAQARVEKMTHEEERGRATARLQQLATAVGGLNVLLPALNQRLTTENPPNAATRSEFDTIRGRLLGYVESKGLLEQMPAGIERDGLVLALVERIGGMIASVQWLDQQLEVAKKNETGASFDSELTLVMWPDDYQLLRWQPNYLRPAFSNSQLPQFYRTLMVSRIDAPTLRLAKGLIDTAIEVEKKGLRGKVYIDARGLGKIEEPNQQPGSFADFDRALLVIANAIDQQTDLPVVVEKTPQLFQPGQCKDAALYCGWYSLGKYVDAFEWVPGAVGYHLASAEAATLREPGSQVWCKRMLEQGVCATIGPVYEPYLVAFPRPEEFFSLLLRGDLTLVECYSLSNPFNSWMMTLIGDPLYRPFKYRAAAAASGETPKPAGGVTPAIAPHAQPAEKP
jgi:uncharacterized protein (TIGR03790 family)